jgi:hypothetical protein
VRSSHRFIRVLAALIATGGVVACGLAILAEDLGLGGEGAGGTFGWMQVSLLTLGGIAVAIGALLFIRPRIVASRFERVRRELRSFNVRWWHRPLIASGLLALAAFLPRAMTAGHFENIDEINWMRRSSDFADALRTFDFSSASAATDDAGTMPGVTTMWLGTIAKGIWSLAERLGVLDGESAFASSAVGLHLAQLAMAAATAVLVGLFVVLAWRWAGAVTAIVAGTLVATEPFFVAHGAELHTDELVGLFGATGTLALMIALGVPGGQATHPRTAAALAGVLLAGALLTKLSALLLAPGVAVIVVWALVRAGIAPRAGETRSHPAVRATGGLLGVVVAAGIVTILLAWPAMWADPINQIELLRDSSRLASAGHVQFFRGEVVMTPVPLLYLVATPFLMTPWFLIGVLTLIPAAFGRATGARLICLAVVAVPAFVGLSLSSHQFERYVLAVLPFLALAVGIGVGATWNRLSTGVLSSRSGRRIALTVAGMATILAFAHTIWVAPWGAVYFNPLLGGSSAAERTILVSGSVGLPLAGELIEQREAPDCDVTIAGLPYLIPSAFPCGSIVGLDHPHPDYLVIEISGRQRQPEEAEALRAAGQTVGVVTVRGITLAEVIDTREGSIRRSRGGWHSHREDRR